MITCTSSARPLEISGGDIHPDHRSSPGADSSDSGLASAIMRSLAPPSRSCSLSAISVAAGVSRILRPSTSSLNATSGLHSACATSTSTTCAVSVGGLLWKANLAGWLANRPCTVILVPSASPDGDTSLSSPSSSDSSAPCCPAGLLATHSLLTAPMDASASPLKPRVPMAARSSAPPSLLVACLFTAKVSSSAEIPCPSSVTTIRSNPPRWISTWTEVAPASMEFSSSSLTT